MHVPPRALEFPKARGRLFYRLRTIVKRPCDDKTVVMEVLQLARGVLRPDDGVDVVVAAAGSPDSLAQVCRQHDDRNVTRRPALPYSRAVRVLALLYTASVLAQGAPNLTGTWVFDREKTVALIASRTDAPKPVTRPGAVSADGGRVSSMTSPANVPQEQTITQSPAALTIERTVADEHQKYVYKLDGTESVSVNGRSTLTTKSQWLADKFVTEGTQVTSTDRGTITNTFREIRTIEETGVMVVETTRKFDGGESTSLQVLVKKSPSTARSWYPLRRHE